MARVPCRDAQRGPVRLPDELECATLRGTEVAMDRTPRSPLPLVLVLLFAAISPGCGGAQKKDKPIQTQTLDEFERNSPPPADPCVGKNGDPIECSNPTDCCQGYACSRDPERNPASRYCLKE